MKNTLEEHRRWESRCSNDVGCLQLTCVIDSATPNGSSARMCLCFFVFS